MQSAVQCCGVQDMFFYVGSKNVSVFVKGAASNIFACSERAGALPSVLLIGVFRKDKRGMPIFRRIKERNFSSEEQAYLVFTTCEK